VFVIDALVCCVLIGVSRFWEAARRPRARLA